MSIKLKHLVTKKIDYTDNRTFFFQVEERPCGMFLISFVFEYSDGQTFKTGIQVESMARKNWKTIKKTRSYHRDEKMVYGYFPVTVPNGQDVVKVHFGAKYGVFGEKTEICTNLEISDLFEDVMKYEELYNSTIKPNLDNGNI